MNNSDDDTEDVMDENIQSAQEVTKMKATSTTSSNEGDQMSPDLQEEIKTLKKKKSFLSKEKKEQAEHSKKYISSEVKEAFDAVQTSKQISHELPKCNWLEDKIRHIELTKRDEECRRLIEEELSTRRSISCTGEKAQVVEQSHLKSETSAFAGIVPIENEELTDEVKKYLKVTPVQNLTESCVQSLRSDSDEGKELISESQTQDKSIESIKKIQDDLMQEKKTLLKDIRIIQKRKIKEMEELFDIKLKKETYEQELEKTCIEIKKMDEYFENIRKRKMNYHEQSVKVLKRADSIDERNQKADSDIKIIDFKTTKEDKNEINVNDGNSTRMSENEPNTADIPENRFASLKNVPMMENENRISKLKVIQSVPPTSQHNVKKNSESLRIRTNILEKPENLKNKEKLETQEQFNQSMPSLSKTSESFRPPQSEQQIPRKVISFEEKSIPSLQQLNYQEQKTNFEQMQRRIPSHDNPKQLPQQNETTRSSSILENFPRGREPNESNRIITDEKQIYSKQLQNYKSQRNQDAHSPFPPQVQGFREYKDGILIAFNKPITMNDPMLPSKEQYIRELQENSYEKQQYQRAMLLPSPPPYQTVNSFITQHEAMLNQRYQENMHIPWRPVPHQSGPMPRIQYLHQNQANLLAFHEQQAAHIRHLAIQKRKEIERYIPQIAQEMKRPNIPTQSRTSALPDEKCEACGKKANFMCSACKGAQYCSTKCQKDRWTEHCKNCIKL